MQRISLCGWSLLMLGASFCLGCAQDAGVPTFPVSGTVTLNGAPAAGIAVSFVPDGSGESAVGVTDATGKYTLTTRKSGDGAVPGRYKVTMAKYEGKETPTTDPSQAHANYDISNEYPPGYNPDAVPEAPPSQNLLPAQYSDPATSGFSAEVVKGENTYNFDLKGGS
jgi:hypothetical protein